MDLKEAGFPDHIVQHAFTDHNVAADIINHPEIASVSFTGSVNGCNFMQTRIVMDEDVIVT